MDRWLRSGQWTVRSVDSPADSPLWKIRSVDGGDVLVIGGLQGAEDLAGAGAVHQVLGQLLVQRVGDPCRAGRDWHRAVVAEQFLDVRLHGDVDEVIGQLLVRRV